MIVPTLVPFERHAELFHRLAQPEAELVEACDEEDGRAELEEDDDDRDEGEDGRHPHEDVRYVPRHRHAARQTDR